MYTDQRMVFHGSNRANFALTFFLEYEKESRVFKYIYLHAQIRILFVCEGLYMRW